MTLKFQEKLTIEGQRERNLKTKKKKEIYVSKGELKENLKKKKKLRKI